MSQITNHVVTIKCSQIEKVVKIKTLNKSIEDIDVISFCKRGPDKIINIIKTNIDNIQIYSDEYEKSKKIIRFKNSYIKYGLGGLILYGKVKSIFAYSKLIHKIISIKKISGDYSNYMIFSKIRSY